MPLVEILEQKGFKFLWIDDYLWMSDVHVEDQEQQSLAQRAHGKVLVAGYGLGLVQKYLLQNENVTSVLTIELLPEVLRECESVYHHLNGDVHIGDFYEFGEDKIFDCVIGDIWPDRRTEWINSYVRFKQKAQRLLKPGGKILAWASDHMEYLLHHQDHSQNL